jgi:hypothetical protein
MIEFPYGTEDQERLGLEKCLTIWEAREAMSFGSNSWRCCWLPWFPPRGGKFVFWRAACANEGPPLVRHAGRLGPLNGENMADNSERDNTTPSHGRHQPGVWLRLGWLIVEGLPLLLGRTGGHVVVGTVVEKNARLNSEKRGSQLKSLGRVELRPESSVRCRSRS